MIPRARSWTLPLTSRIVLIFVLLAAALLSTVGVVFHDRVRESLEAASVSELLIGAVEKEAALTGWLDQRVADLDQFSHDEDLQERVASLIGAVPGSRASRAAHALVLKELAPHMTGARPVFIEIFVMEPERGTVVASTSASEEGKPKAGHPYFDNGRNGTFIESPYRSAGVKDPAITAAVPLRLPSGRLLAVLAARLDYAAVNAIAERRSGLRETDEAFRINRVGLLVTQPRFIKKPAVLSQAIRTEAAQRCVTGASGVSLAPDFRGVSTISVYRWIPGHDLCLIASIDQAEALAPADAFAHSVLLVSALALLVTAGLAFLLARTITKPLRALQDSVGQFAEGRDSGAYLQQGDDELAQLALAFTQMQTRVALRSAELAESNVALQRENAERERAQEVMRESETKFKQMAETITDVFWVTSLDFHTMHYVSPAIEKIWGVSVASMYARPLLWQEAIVPEDRERFNTTIGRLVDHPSVTAEYRITRPDGTIRWIHDRGFQVLDAEGKPYRLTGIASDITERKKAEVQASIQSAVSRVLAESSSAEEAAHRLLQVVSEYAGWEVGSVWLIDQRSNVMRCGEVWNRVDCPVAEFRKASLGTTMARGEGLPGRVWASGSPAWIVDLAQDGNFPRAGAALANGLHAGFAFPIVVGSKVSGVLEFYCREPRDPDTDLLQTFATLGSQFGQFVQNRQLEGQLFQSQRLETVGKLAGGIAHEFNSILTAIIGQSEMMLSGLPTGDPLVKNAVEIRKAADRAATLTGQLLAFGRKLVMRPEVLDLNQIVADMEGMLYHLMGGDVDLRVIPAADLHAVRADAGQLEQVLMNIAINAREAMPHGGKLTLETSNVTVAEESVGGSVELKPGDYAMLAMSDTGTGMGPEVRARLFEPFFSTKGVGQGTGLGLATCYGIIKQSGGHISVYSELGRGTTFKIYLPQVQRSAALPLREPLGMPRGNETILLVEDDPVLCELAAILLRRLGYKVLAASGGTDALRLVEHRGAEPIQLLFTDVVMPNVDGKHLADRIVALYPATRVLFTSAYTENTIVHQGMLGADVALLQKPFTPSALAHKVREVLDRV